MEPLWKLAYEYLFYAMYLPYSTALVVNFEDFKRQLQIRSRPSIASAFGSLFRLILWYAAMESWTRVYYSHALMKMPRILVKLPLTDLVSINYLAGIQFYLAYLVIFGHPIWVARCVDGKI